VGEDDERALRVAEGIGGHRHFGVVSELFL
jgi:hypothetical protein